MPLDHRPGVWHGAVVSNHDLERQRLTSNQLNEHRVVGSASWI